MEFLNGSHLSDSLFDDDEAEMLQSEPEVADLFQTYPLDISVDVQESTFILGGVCKGGNEL